MTHEANSTVDKCVKNVSHRKKYFFKKCFLIRVQQLKKTSHLAVLGQSPNDLSNIYLGPRALLEKEVEHLLPDINNQNVVSVPLLEMNDIMTCCNV